MAEPTEGSSLIKERAFKDEDEGSKRSCGYMFFFIISAVTVIAAASMALSQVLTVIVVKVPFLQFLLRLYVFIFCFAFILTEFEAPFFVKRFSSFDNWIFRGWIYSFVGLIGVEEAHAKELQGEVKNHVFKASISGKALSYFIMISSLVLVACGVIYFVMGICCIKRVKDKVKKKHEEQTTTLVV